MGTRKKAQLSEQTLEELQDMMAQYGWSINEDGWVDSTKNKQIGRLEIDSKGRYKYMLGGNKVWGGYGNLISGFEKFLQEFYYVQKQ